MIARRTCKSQLAIYAGGSDSLESVDTAKDECAQPMYIKTIASDICLAIRAKRATKCNLKRFSDDMRL